MTTSPAPLPAPDQRPEESLFFAALSVRQDQMKKYETFLIYVQPWVRTRNGRRFRPDFVVHLRSSLGVQIDGSGHRGRYAADRTQDELLMDHNLPVLRFPVEDLNDRVLVEDWVDRIVSRVRGFRWMPAA